MFGRGRVGGGEVKQITKDDVMESWFPHISPDGKSMVFLTYDKGAGDHRENKDVALRLMDLTTRNAQVLTKLFGGQGTINVSSWSPDSRYVAFVSYQLIPQ